MSWLRQAVASIGLILERKVLGAAPELGAVEEDRVVRTFPWEMLGCLDGMVAQRRLN